MNNALCLVYLTKEKEKNIYLKKENKSAMPINSIWSEQQYFSETEE